MEKINKEVSVYVVDDDKALNTMIATYLKKSGYKNIEQFYTGEDVLKAIKEKAPEIVIQDYDLPGKNGLQVLKEVRKANPKIEFIMLSGQKEMEVTIKTLTNGAFDYIMKDSFAKENVKHKIEKLLKIKRLEEEKRSLKVLIGVALGIIVSSWVAISFVIW